MRILLTLTIAVMSVAGCSPNQGKSKEEVSEPVVVENDVTQSKPTPKPVSRPKRISKSTLHNICKELSEYPDGQRKSSVPRVAGMAFEKEGVPFTGRDQANVNGAVLVGGAGEAGEQFAIAQRELISGVSVGGSSALKSAFIEGCFEWMEESYPGS